MHQDSIMLAIHFFDVPKNMLTLLSMMDYTETATHIAKDLMGIMMPTPRLDSSKRVTIPV